ncbi:TPA: hypothetical protein MHT91_05030 [Klebsiella pneumoniae]|nr:hypothetical protein [Klebsiella pneumoniae]
MLLKNILFPILLRAQEVKCWLRMSHFSAILYALNITCYVLTYSADDAFNTMIYGEFLLLVSCNMKQTNPLKGWRRVLPASRLSSEG